MLFKVEMVVKLPVDMPAAQADELKKTERELAQKLQASGKWRHLWRIAGHYANYSVFDLPSVEALHDTLMQLPLFPYMDIEIDGLCRHPSSIHTDDR